MAFLDVNHKKVGFLDVKHKKSGVVGYESQTKWPFGCESGASKVQAWADLRFNLIPASIPEEYDFGVS